jgi:hypothetical protein
MVVRNERAAGGHPFFAVEIARLLPEHARASVVALPMPDRLLEVVEALILVLPQRARLVLLTAASARPRSNGRGPRLVARLPSRCGRSRG